MWNPIKQANKIVDDLRAAQEDIASGHPDLVRSGLATLAAIYTETAERTDRVPGLGRMAEFMREQADAAHEEIAEIEAGQSRARELTEKVLREVANDYRLADLQAARTKEAHRKAGQGDLFGTD